MLDRDFAIGLYDEEVIDLIGPERFYKVSRKYACLWSLMHERELAEGPTQLIKQKYNIVEIWPLVVEVS